MPSRRAALRTLGSALIVGLAGCATQNRYDEAAVSAGDETDWLSAGHDRHNTRYVPDGTGPTSGVTERWRTTIGLGCTEPAVVGDAVLLTENGPLRALDAETGEKRWVVDAEDDGVRFFGTPTVYDGRVYVGGLSGDVAAFDLETGTRQWTHEFESLAVGPPTVASEGYGLFVTAGESVARLDSETGDLEWQRKLFGRLDRPIVVDEHSHSVVAVAESGDVYALDETTGDGFWRTGLPDRTTTPPTMAGEKTVVGCFDGNLYALGTRGQIEWSTQVGGFAKGGIGIADGTVYAEAGRALHAIDRKTGGRRWRYALGTIGDRPPAIVDDTIYVGGSRLYALEPGGSVGVHEFRIAPERFTAGIDDRVGSVVAASGSLYVTTFEEDVGQYLVRLDPEDEPA